eukprot:g3878.t1
MAMRLLLLCAAMVAGASAQADGSAQADPTCEFGFKTTVGDASVCCASACSPVEARAFLDTEAGSNSCDEVAPPCVVQGSDQVHTLTTEELQKLVQEMNNLDSETTVSKGDAKSILSLKDVIIYSKDAPTWDLKKQAQDLYTSADLPAMEPLELAPIARPVTVPPLPTVLPPQGTAKCHGGKVASLEAYSTCTEIEGGLFVIDMDITNLDDLKNVEKITGPLVIEGNKNLKDIRGLSKVQGHVDSIGIFRNPRLKFVEGLEGVTSTGSVMISDNEELAKLDALAHICGELQYGLGVRNNPSLRNLDGLTCLKKLGASGEGIAVQIDGNDALEQIEALNNVQELEGGAMITNNKGLERLGGLNSVTRIGRDKNGNSIVLNNNAVLKKCDAFAKATKTEGSVTVYNNTELLSTDCLAKVATFGKDKDGNGVILADNPKLNSARLEDAVDIAGSLVISGTALAHLQMAVLEHVGTDSSKHSVRLSNNPQLASAKLSSLNRTSGSVQIWNNEQLRSTGLFNLLFVGADARGVSVELARNALMSKTDLVNLVETEGGVALVSNPNMVNTDLFSLEKVGKADSNGNCFEVVDNQALTKIDAVALKKCDGGVRVMGNKQLTDLGIEHISFLGKNANGQSVVIRDNGALPTLKGFPQVTELTGSISIDANPSLHTLQGAESVSTVGADDSGNSLEVANNDVLESVAALKNAKVFQGALEIQNNKKLKALDFDNLSDIKGKNMLGDSVVIEGNSILRDLSGLKAIHGVLPGAISISGNDGLVSIAGLNVNGAKPNVYGNSIEIIKNKRLMDMTGLKLGGTLDGAVVVSGNGMLKKLTGLCNITSIMGMNAAHNSLDLHDNPELVDAACLSKLGGLVEGDIDLSNTNLATVKPLVQGENPITQVLGNIKMTLLHCLDSDEVSLLSDLCDAKPGNTGEKCKADLATVNQCSFSGGNVLIGSGDQSSSICGGASNVDWKAWKASGSSGLYIDVDTSECAFKMTPGYVTSVQGDAGHWQLVGVNSIYSATKDSFRVYVWHPTLRGSYLQYFATRYHWRVNWVADSSQHAGVTRPGRTGWKAFAKDTVYADVDTTACGYTKVPSVITALHGSRDHWRTQGVHSVYRATATGFRVYVTHADGMTPAKAEAYHWAVAWIGSTDSRRSGFSKEDWKVYCGDHSNCEDDKHYFALSMDVTTGAYASMGVDKSQDVTYVTSVSGSGPHLLATGGASLYRPTSSSFRVYLSHAPTAAFANKNGWKVNWIGYSKPKDCTLANWGDFSPCTKHCGGGTKTRKKKVLSSASVGGYCPKTEETRDCNTWSCNLDCTMGDWSSWGPCSASCGHGSSRRKRDVTRNAKPGGRKCPPSVSVKLCTHGPCPVHCQTSKFSAWSPCTKTCDGGWRVRSRHVIHRQESGGSVCPNLTEKDFTCGAAKCPVNCKLGNWGKFLPCSKDCGRGYRIRSRPVEKWPAHGGIDCDAFNEAEICNDFPCSQKCTTTDWSDWTDCDVTCGTGSHSRTRTVTARRVDNQELCPASKETQACFEGHCPVDCDVTKWTKWSLCTRPCGGGIKARTRKQVNKVAGSQTCPPFSETLACNEQTCPRDCSVTQWSRWTPCSTTCGKGKRTRDRAVIDGPLHQGKNCGAVHQVQWCNEDKGCPIHCKSTMWMEPTPCSEPCGYGNNTKIKKILQPAANGGTACPTKLTRTFQCIIKPCPSKCHWSQWSPCQAGASECGVGRVKTRKMVLNTNVAQDCDDPMTETRKCADKPCVTQPCRMGDWGNWGKCSASCGTGVHRRSRNITYNGDGNCDSTSETEPCSDKPCPINCLVGRWSGYGPCSAKCGPGRKTMTRKVRRKAQYNGTPCPVTELDAACKDKECPVDCTVHDWGDWDKCDKTCGGGYERRERKIKVNQDHGGKRCPATNEEKQCNWFRCPIACETSRWSGFGKCTTSCGVGTKTRSRTVTVKPQHKGTACGNLTETDSCDMGPCPLHCEVSSWSGWGSCTRDGQVVSCDGGRKTRSRSVVTEKNFGGRICPHLTDDIDCADTPCPIPCVLDYWGNWTKCTEECGRGSQRQTRRVIQTPRYGGTECKKTEQWQSCNVHPCPVDCDVTGWSTWTPCAGECGKEGVTHRKRTINKPAIGTGKACPTGTDLKNTTTCQMDRCPEYCDVSDWGGFGPCSTNCSDGVSPYGRKTRTRSVLTADLLSVCPTLDDDVECGTTRCPIDCEYTEWGHWEPFFGGGTTMRRTRQITRPADFKGTPCPTERSQTKSADWCTTQSTTSPSASTGWSTCKGGYTYKHHEKIECDSKANVRYHYVFRQGKHCSAAVTQSMLLDEEVRVLPKHILQAKWRTLSLHEVRQYGLEKGHWQKML